MGPTGRWLSQCATAASRVLMIPPLHAPGLDPYSQHAPHAPQVVAGMRALTPVDAFARTQRTANCADTTFSDGCHVHDMTNLDIIGYQEVDPGVGAVKREPTSPGPITDLFARLDDLHSRAGRPSMREIAIRAGRGNISSSTVHNIFRSPRVPKWGFLEQVVRALGGGPDRDEFLLLWQAAWRAENGAQDGGVDDTQPQITAGVQRQRWRTGATGALGAAADSGIPARRDQGTTGGRAPAVAPDLVERDSRPEPQFHRPGGRA